MPGSQKSVDQASPKITCGTLTATGTGIDGYTPLLPNHPCRSIWLGPPTANTPGAQVNASDVLVGDATTQNAAISPTDKGQYFQVQNANMIHLKFVNASDKLEYRIED